VRLTGTVHIIGAGLAGLSTAVHLVEAGRRVIVYESSGHAGGRCRSFYDEHLGRSIDNGNHLILSGNQAAERYLRITGGTEGFIAPDFAEYPFVDLETGERWAVRPDRGAIPWSLLFQRNRIPGSRVIDYLRGMRLSRAAQNATVWACLGDSGILYNRFWEPLAVSVLNTPADEASAALLWPVIRETFGRGEAACRPLIARKGLSDALVDPALEFIEDHGGVLRMNERVTSLKTDRSTVSAISAQSGEVTVESEDTVVVAVPAPVAGGLLPGLIVPDVFEPIVNAHFLLPDPIESIRFLGLVGGICHWLFVRGDVASVTVSAARDLAALPGDKIADRMWPEVLAALGLRDIGLGRYRIIKEKRATFSQTPEQIGRRPGPHSDFDNLMIAGDWTDTGLPATIEGSIRSGETVAAKIKEGV